MYGKTFYGRHTAQHQLQWSQIRSFKSNGNIHKKEGGTYYVVSAKKFRLKPRSKKTYVSSIAIELSLSRGTFCSNAINLIAIDCNQPST